MRKSLFAVKRISGVEYEAYWRQVIKTNLLQSCQYGQAKKLAEGWKPYLFLIYDEGNTPIGLTQILAKTIPFIGGIARINRGPLLIGRQKENETVEIVLKAIESLLNYAMRERWWIVQIAPNLPVRSDIKENLSKLGLRSLKDAAWGSGIIDLQRDENSIMMNFDGKWRNCLRKGLRLGVHVRTCQPVGRNIELLIQEYSYFQTSKGFKGLSTKLIKYLAIQKGETWHFNLSFAYENAYNVGHHIGAIVTIHHGDTATYLIGITNEIGRKLQANYVLLWRAILDAKSMGCHWFDIGGLSDVTPAGVFEFKKGLKAEPYRLIGEWRWNFINQFLKR